MEELLELVSGKSAGLYRHYRAVLPLASKQILDISTGQTYRYFVTKKRKRRENLYRTPSVLLLVILFGEHY